MVLSIPSLLYEDSSGDLSACVGVLRLAGPLTPGFLAGMAMENFLLAAVLFVTDDVRSFGEALPLPGLAVVDMELLDTVSELLA